MPSPMKTYLQNYHSMQLPDESRKDTVHRLQPLLLQKAWTGLFPESRPEPSEFVQARTSSGKPFLPAHPGFHYNFSDSGDYLVLAVSPDHEIGVDLQKITPVHAGVLRTAKRFFHPDDLRLLQNQKDAEEQLSLFFRIWTVKEAFVKCTGEGLSGGMNRFPVDFQSCRIGGKAFTELEPPAGYFLTVVE